MTQKKQGALSPHQKMDKTTTKILEDHIHNIRAWAGHSPHWEDQPFNVGYALMVAADIEKHVGQQGGA